jgi:hypothetical protein
VTDGECEYRFAEDSISRVALLAHLDFSEHSYPRAAWRASFRDGL